MYPSLDGAALRATDGAVAESVIAARPHTLMTSGRAAIARALAAYGIGGDDEVLVPAYCCLAMTAPIKARGAQPVYYSMRDDLTIDLGRLQDFVTERTRAVIAVHYFGAATPLLALRSWCDARDLMLLEDCAHAFYTASGPELVGGVGHAGIASIMKFLPTCDGGALWFNVAGSDTLSAVAPRATTLREILSLVERSRLPAAGLIRLAAKARSGVKRRVDAVAARPANASQSADGEFDFVPQTEHLAASGSTRWLLRRDSAARIKQRRRAHFEYLAHQLQSIGGVRLFWPTLPAGAIPYVLPCLFERGDEAFRILRARGVQVFRWEFTEQHGCETTRRYARSLLQLPVHQSLQSAELDIMVDAIRAAAAAS
ncbi:MAG: DegT/DnrJ/EryC1/StrS family aminotransferase [Steroidobacteraceae bacterium]